MRTTHHSARRLFAGGLAAAILTIGVIGAGAQQAGSTQTVAVKEGEIDANDLAHFLGISHTVLKLQSDNITAICLSCDVWQDGHFVKTLGANTRLLGSNVNELTLLWRQEKEGLRVYAITDCGSGTGDFCFPLSELGGEWKVAGCEHPKCPKQMQLGEGTPIFKQYLDLESNKDTCRVSHAGFDAKALAQNSKEYDAVLVSKLALFETHEQANRAADTALE